MSEEIVKRPGAAPMTASDVDLPSLFQLAGALMQARGFLPSHIKTEGECVAIILAGQEMGIPPMRALRSISLVQGRPIIDASQQLALVKDAGIRHKWLSDGRNGEAELWLHRPGDEEHVEVFSMEDAKRAGLAGKDTWKKYPAAMLRARCVSSAVRAYCPDVLGGAAYVPGEIPGSGSERPPPPSNNTVQGAVLEVEGQEASDEIEERKEAHRQELEAARELVNGWVDEAAKLESAESLARWVAWNGYQAHHIPHQAKGRLSTALGFCKAYEDKACGRCGVSRDTLKRWIQEAPESPDGATVDELVDAWLSEDVEAAQ